jgi:type I restriction enzyme, S subunit
MTKTVRLGSIAEIFSGGTPSREQPAYWGGDIPWVKTTQIQNRLISAGDIDERITQEGLKKSSARMVPCGTILMAMIGQGKTRGQVAILGVDAATNQNAAAIVVKGKYDRDYVYQQLLFRYAEIRAISNSSGQQNLNLELIRSINFPDAALPRQVFIGSLLSKWDESIDLSEQMIAATHQRRKWLVQQLLTGKRRLPGFNERWPLERLAGCITATQRSIPKPTQAYKALGIRSHCKGTFERVVTDPASVDMDELFVVRAGDLIVNITFAWEGAIAFVPIEHDGHLVSHRFPTYRLKENRIDPGFLRYVVTHPLFIFQLGLISPGGAGRNRVMSKKDFLNIKIPVPSLEEQRKIGQLLESADTEIRLLNQQLDAFREQKKGLMQQLLTGRVRVKA